MQVMPVPQRVLMTSLVAVLSGCFASDGGACFHPLEEFIPPETAAAAQGGGGLGGQCGAWVEIGDVDGNWYLDTRTEGWQFHIDGASVEEYGEAAEATRLVGSVAEATVWSVSGLDPRDFVVMRSADDAFFILVQTGAHLRVDVDATLCRHATGDETTLRERCSADPP
jgi:hypothetical protein